MASVIQIIAQPLIQRLITQGAVEGLDEGVLLGFPWINVLLVHAIIVYSF